MLILGIESSCDETAAALVEDGIKEWSSCVSSSKELHEKTGGVVPEIAARKQIEFVVPVIEETMKEFALKKGLAHWTDVVPLIDSLAVTVGPGLLGSLLVGLEAAKALAFAWDKPLIPVNHLVAHLYANFIDNPQEITFPALGLLVSGGHTDLVLIKAHGDLEYLGGTVDDAAGEAFDKTARMLGLAAYLGGALISKEAEKCTNQILPTKLPRPMIHEKNYDFSFSGLKTAVKRLVESGDFPTECVAKEFEEAVVDVLVTKTVKAALQFNVKCVLMGGGVSANTLLRSSLKNALQKHNLELFVPPLRLCTDNAVYIAGSAYFNKDAQLSLEADPSLGIVC